MDYKDITAIRDDYCAGVYVPSKQLTDEYAALSLYPEGFIFDEDLSVKKNRELVQDHNNQVISKKQEYRHLANKLFRQLRDDVIDYIAGTYSFSKSRAQKIEEFVYASKHSYMYDYFGYIDEIANLCYDIVYDS